MESGGGGGGGRCTNSRIGPTWDNPKNVIFVGRYRRQLIQQPIKMTQFRIVPRRTDPTVSAAAFGCQGRVYTL